MSYSTKTKTVVKPSTKVENITSEDYINAGYTLIKRDAVTNKITIKYSKNYEAKKRELEEKNYKTTLNAMINNWNKYRDEINDLLGDMSPYINYKEIIQKMIDEDNYILEKINSRKNAYLSDNDSDFYSEDESLNIY
uniref:Uncharacterized protein n=1 Tax=viral metagenome TaxID=1070528 RepID=A0A6C0DX35_9ZZZZ